VERPLTRYALSGDVSIAYQLFGDGPVNLVWAPGFVSHLDLDWDSGVHAHVNRRLAAFSSCIHFDKRGTGLSDRSIDTASIDDRMDDIRAVMDDAAMERAALMGGSEGGPLAILFAAMYPDRVSALVLNASYAEPLEVPDLDGRLDKVESYWGSGRPMRTFDPLMDVEAAARYERSTATPRMAAFILRINTTMDVRAALPAISCPTLVTHRTGDPVIPVAYGRKLAAAIPHCRYIERPGDSHRAATLEEVDQDLDDIEEFLTGVRRGSDPDRMLMTVLFTDIVSSTARVGLIRDRGWRVELENHGREADRLVRQFRGRVVKSTGDGILAVFDGPSRAVRCAIALVERAKHADLVLRAGLHAGEIELINDDVAGIAVNLAQRVEATAHPGEVLVSQTVRDLLAGSDIHLTDRGHHTLKGFDEPWHLFSATVPGNERP
jgi:class 3 adenylate cyclase